MFIRMAAGLSFAELSIYSRWAVPWVSCQTNHLTACVTDDGHA